MITNRRIYYFHPAKIENGVALLRDLHQHTIHFTGRDFRGMTCLYGPVSTIVFDMRFHDEEDMHKFSSIWYPALTEINFIETWFQNVKQMTSELWFFPEDEKSNARAVSEKVDGYWGNITYRLTLQPYSSCYNAAVDMAKEIQTRTKDVFRKDLIIAQCYLGSSNQIAFEIDFENIEQQNIFTEGWMRWLKEGELFESLFNNFQEGASELWQTLE